MAQEVWSESIRNESGGPVCGLLLFFSHTRTRIETVASLLPQQRAEAVAGRVTYLLEWPEAELEPDASTLIEITYEGEPPVLRSAIWLTRDGGGADFAAMPAEPPETVSASRAHDAAVHYTTSAEKEFVRRLSEIERDPDDERRREKRFFYDLDRATHPALAQPNLRKAIDNLSGHLQDRLIRRGLAAKEGRLFQGLPEEKSWMKARDEKRRADAREACELLHRLSLEAFGTEETEQALCRFERAFERFASGRLHAFDSHGSPNGFLYLCFAEAALTFIDLELREAFWRPRLNVLVRTAEVFLELYWGGRGRNRASYAWKHLDRSRRRFTKVRMQHLRAHYRGLGESKLKHAFQALVAWALRDTLANRTSSFACPVPEALTPEAGSLGE